MMIKVNNVDIHCLSSGPTDGQTLVLLHGASFHSGTWLELGTLEFFAERGYRVIAVDLPGFGKSVAMKSGREKFLEDLLSSLGLDKPVVLSPSMSGRFAFPLLLERPEIVGGFIPVAPALTAEYAPKLKNCKVPTLVLWGEKDDIFSVKKAHLLSENLPNSQKTIFKGAGHACYLEQTESFHAVVLDFMESLTR